LLYVGVGSIAAGVVALAVGLAINGNAPVAPQAVPADVSASPTFRQRSADLEVLFGSRTPAAPGMRLASLEAGSDSDFATEERQSGSRSVTLLGPRVSFDERFVFRQNLVSFEDRFGAAGSTAVASHRSPARAIDTETHTIIASIASSPPVESEPARPAVAQVSRAIARAIAPAPSAPPAGAPDKQLAYASPESIPDAETEADRHTAIYDIVAHTVYLPNGQKLEAHSGLGERMDDPRQINAKGQGPTPPNVYKLTLRERPFHGVRAIRLIPVDETKMFGRDGMLAHTYMLGPNGQSNGCVSFNDYQAFLNAFQNGEIDRLVVVEHLATEPGSKTASGSWLPQAIRDLFTRS
jgi:hypothetical protein